MRLNFINSNDLEGFIREAKGMEYFPPSSEIIENLKGKIFRIVYAEKDGKIIGGCLWFEKNSERSHLYLAFIKQIFRGNKYSSELMSHAIKQMEKEGYSKVSCFVDRVNLISLKTFLGQGFNIEKFLPDKDRFLLLKQLDDNTDYKDIVYDILLELNIEEKRKNLKRLLKNPKKVLEIIKEQDSSGIGIREMTPINRLRYLRYLADSDNPEGLEALEELSKSLGEISELKGISERLKLLKYVAIHGEKAFSIEAGRRLYENLPGIISLKNPELKASLLRYLAIHLNGEKQQEVINLIRRLGNKKVEETSMDYFNIYFKNG